jgi:autotransporter-associated beta strand protein
MHTWTGLSTTDSNWSDADNWDAAGPPVAGTLDNQLVFPAAARQSNTNDLNNLFASTIKFAAPGYVLGGNVIAMVGDTTISAAITSGTDTIALPIDQSYVDGGTDPNAFQYNHVFDVTAGGTLDVSGQINGFFADLNVGGVLINPNLLRKTDAGALVLSNGTNSWSGDTFLDAGTLRQAAAGAIPGSTCVQVAAGAVLDLGGFATSLGCVSGSGNISVASGSLTVGADNSDTTFNGVISGAGGLTKLGSGTFMLDAVNTYAGATSVLAGILAQGIDNATPPSPCFVAAGATFDLNGFNAALGSLSGGGTVSAPPQLVRTLTAGLDNTSTTFSGAIQGGLNLTKLGSGTFTLGGVGTYTGATSILAGELAQGIDNATPPSPCIVAAGATFDLNGFNAALGSLSGGGTVYAPNQPIRTLTTGLDNGPTAFSGVIQGGLNLTKVGTGAFNLTGVNTYTGATTVSTGAMLVNGALAATSAVTVSGSSAVLGGTGTVGAVFVSNGGTISPGNSPGILHTGPVMWGAGSAYRAELNGPDPGNGYDQLQVSGTADLSAGPTLSLSLGFVPVAGQKFTILQADQVTGTFAGLENGSAVVLNGLTFHIHYTPRSVFLTFGTED